MEYEKYQFPIIFGSCLKLYYNKAIAYWYLIIRLILITHVYIYTQVFFNWKRGFKFQVASIIIKSRFQPWSSLSINETMKTASSNKPWKNNKRLRLGSIEWLGQGLGFNIWSHLLGQVQAFMMKPEFRLRPAFKTQVG